MVKRKSTSSTTEKDKSRSSTGKKLKRLHDRATDMADYLLDEDNKVTTEEYEERHVRLEELVYESTKHVLDSREMVSLAEYIADDLKSSELMTLICCLMKKTGVEISVFPTAELKATVAEGVAAGFADRKKRTQNPEATIISKVAAFVLPSLVNLPAENRDKNMDENKHVSFKAATIMFRAESSQGSDTFKVDLAARLKTMKSESLRKVRAVFFDSMAKAAEKLLGRPDLVQDDKTVTLKYLEEHLLPTWTEQISDEGAGVFANNAFLSMRVHHEDQQQGGEDPYRQMHEILGLDGASDFDAAVVKYVCQEIRDWAFETLNEDRKKHRDDNPPDESQDSADALLNDPAVSKNLHDQREADGFGASQRLRDWIRKYKDPAVGGGNSGKEKGGGGNSGKGKGKAKARKDLDTNDDQRFNKKVMERLGLARKRLVKVQKLTSQTMTSRDDAGKLFRPYLSQETAVAAAPVAAAAAPVAAAA